MSPTLNYHKTSDRKIDFRLNNNILNINNNLIFDNNLIFESMPDLEPILDFDGGEGMDEIDGNIVSNGDNHSNGDHRNNEGMADNSSKKKEFKATEALVRKQAPTFLLIESLIWNFCCSNETDRQKQRLLFESLCEHLNTLKLIGSSYRSDSLQPIREFIVKKFNELLVEIRSHDKRFNSLLSSCNPMSNTIIYNSPHLIHKSRYRDDFEDLGLIEAGGFGVVNKAKYRFDDCEYAVKMIRFKYTDKYDSVFKKIIREVQLYANLSSHPNVVAYKTAWLENWCLHREPIPLSKHMTNGINKNNQFLKGIDDMLNTSERYSKDTENDVSIRFEESSKSGIRIESSNVQINGTLECNQTIEMEIKHEDEEDDEEEEEEESSSDEEYINDSNGSKETYKMLSLSDLSAVKQSIGKRKKTFSMSSTQSHSDSAVEYRDSFVLQKYHNRDIPDIKVDDFQANDCPFSCSNFGAVLYIQMELCGKNLKTWLRTRNDHTFAVFAEYMRKQKLENKSISLNAIDFMDEKDIKEAKNIFRQVLKGVEYIHSQHLIHRDLKPQNILFSADGSKVKIGDFGLATLHNSIIDSEVISMYKQSSPSTSTVTNGHNDLNHTGNIGTSIYASPEQKSRKDYDNKTDLFSLGIILFELFYPLSTEMEKVNCVSNITKKQVLPKGLILSFPNVAKIIQTLTHPNPVCRPNASDLLHSLLFLTEEQIIIRQTEDQNKQLINELVAKENKIKDLENNLQFKQRIITEKDKQIENLKKQLEVMNEKIKFFS